VYPLHPATDHIGGVTCYPHFANMPQMPGGVVVCVPPADAVSAVRDAAEAGVRRVWLQQGSESEYVEQLCRDLHVECVSGECILKFADPHGIHRVHRVIDDALHLGPR
jgi:predicted CoA-binding protein